MKACNPYHGLIVAVGFVTMTSLLFAAPADLSVAAHQRWKSTAKDRIEQKIKQQFAAKEAAMETMSTPFKIGDEVEVVIQQGNRARKIRGKFKDFDGSRAHIGEVKYLLSDISKVDADRIRFGKHPELLQLTLEQMRREVETEKAKVRQVSLKRMANEAGYTENFLESSVELGGRYWPYADLGEGKLTAHVNMPADTPYVDIVVQNESGTACSTVFILGKQAVSATLPSDGKSIPKYGESPWSRHRFRLKTSDLGDDPVAFIVKNLRLWTVRNETASWQFTCGRSRVQNNRGTIDLEMPRLRVKHHSSANVRNMTRYAVAAARYQESIEVVIAAQTAELEAARAAADAKKKAEEAEVERRKNERIAATKLRKEAESDYIWLTVEQAKQLNVGMKLDRRVLTDAMFNDVNYPSETTIGEQKFQVLRFTNWEKRNAVTPDRDRLALCEVVAMKFRVMRLMYADVYKRKMTKLKAEKTALDAAPTSENPDGISPGDLSPQAYDEFGPGGPGAPGGFGPGGPGYRQQQARKTAEDVVDETTTEFLEKLEEPDDEDEKDSRPDPGYLVQYRASFQNTLSESVEYVATITLGYNEGDDLVWTDKYRPISQYLGPIYGNKIISIDDLKRGLKKIKLAGEVTNGEAIRERRAKEHAENLKNQPTRPAGGSVRPGGGRKKPGKGLFD